MQPVKAQGGRNTQTTEVAFTEQTKNPDVFKWSLQDWELHPPKGPYGWICPKTHTGDSTRMGPGGTEGHTAAEVPGHTQSAPSEGIFNATTSRDGGL